MMLVDGDVSKDLGALRRVVTVVSDGYVMDARRTAQGGGLDRAAEIKGSGRCASGRRWLIAAAAPLPLTGCLWGPGKFTSDLALKPRRPLRPRLSRRDPAAVPRDRTEDKACAGIDEHGALLRAGRPHRAAGSNRQCGRTITPKTSAVHQAAEIAKLKSWHMKSTGRGTGEARAKNGRADGARCSACRVPTTNPTAPSPPSSKYAGWRSVTYRGKGVFDVDYHFEGRLTQDYRLPADARHRPDPALRRDPAAERRVGAWSTAPALTGGARPFGARAKAAGHAQLARRAGVAWRRAASPSRPTAKS